MQQHVPRPQGRKATGVSPSGMTIVVGCNEPGGKLHEMRLKK